MTHHPQADPHRAQEERNIQLNAVFEVAVDAIITTDHHGVIEMTNPAATRMFGYKQEEMEGHNVKMLMPEPDRSQHDGHLARYQQTGEARIIGTGRMVWGRTKNGKLFPLRLSVSEVRMKERIVYAGIFHDITELKAKEDKLANYTRELERSNRELQEFAYISSHDLQEPLRKIQAFGDRLYHREFDNLSGRGKDYLNRMLNAAGRMSNLINDLLSYSRVTTKARPFEQVDLSKVAAEVVSDLEVQIERLRAQVRYFGLPVIEADPTQMRQLFQNIIGNSLKFRQEGTPPVVRISALQEAPDDRDKPAMVHLRFADNGTGFEDKYKQRVFTIFQRLEGTKYEGSGIGLAICKRIVDRHLGEVDVDSAPGRGTTFHIRLPIHQQYAQDHGN